MYMYPVQNVVELRVINCYYLIMKTLHEYILMESPKRLRGSETGLIVFDIDDTLLKANASDFHIYKNVNGKEIALTTDEFAKDPDAANPDNLHSGMFDYRDFGNPEKVYMSIITGTPLLRNLRILDDYVEAGYEFCFLTARQCEDVVKKAIDSFLQVRRNGVLEPIGDAFNKTLSHAVNDKLKNYPGKTDAEKKANILIKLCQTHDRVVFVDDDHKNVNAAINLNIPNLKVIKAWD